MRLRGRRDKFNFTDRHKKSYAIKRGSHDLRIASKNTFAPLSTSLDTLRLVNSRKIQEKKVSLSWIDEYRCHVRKYVSYVILRVRNVTFSSLKLRNASEYTVFNTTFKSESTWYFVTIFQKNFINCHFLISRFSGLHHTDTHRNFTYFVIILSLVKAI